MYKACLLPLETVPKWRKPLTDLLSSSMPISPSATNQKPALKKAFSSQVVIRNSISMYYLNAVCVVGHREEGWVIAVCESAGGSVMSLWVRWLRSSSTTTSATERRFHSLLDINTVHIKNLKSYQNGLKKTGEHSPCRIKGKCWRWENRKSWLVLRYLMVGPDVSGHAHSW